MKIEVGKTYKNREGTVVGPIEVNYDDDFPFSAYSGPVFLTYTTEGTWFGVEEDETQEDLVEECNADGSPIVSVEPAKAPDREQWAEAAERMRREGIALAVLPALIGLGTDLFDSDMPEDATYAQIAVSQAFYIADEFIKVAKQS